MDQEVNEIRLAPEYLEADECLEADDTDITLAQVQTEPQREENVIQMMPGDSDEIQDEEDETEREIEDEVEEAQENEPLEDEIEGDEPEEEWIDEESQDEAEIEVGLPENVFIGAKTPLNLQLFALCRSGNHAIIEWMLRNVCHHPIENVRGVTGLYVQQSKEDGVYFRNNVNHTVPDQKRWKPPRQYKLMIESHEDTPIRSIRSGYTAFAIIREFGNLLASRYQKFWAEDSKRLAHWSREPHNRTYLIRIKELIAAWKNHARSIQQKKVIGVLYDRWVVDLAYRNSVMELFGLHNWADDRSNVSECGDGSSFIGMELENDHSRYLNRWEQVEFPADLKRAVLADKELITLNKELFGTDLEQEMK